MTENRQVCKQSFCTFDKWSIRAIAVTYCLNARRLRAVHVLHTAKRQPNLGAGHHIPGEKSPLLLGLNFCSSVLTYAMRLGMPGSQSDSSEPCQM